ncbi:MAG: aldo/keto reductase family protein [Pseudomonadota bacterium]
MQYRELGHSGLRVSEISLGSWLTYGTAIERQQAQACLDAAFDHGINLIDTANMYGKGAAESLLGELLVNRPRSTYLLATKVYYPMSDTDRGLSRSQIEKQLDASLTRLNTDYIDLYQCHRYDENTPLEETMKALTRAIRSGKVRHIGFSEWSRSQIRAANKLQGVARFTSSQPRYSMLYRKPERKIFPLCDDLKIGQIVWSPLSQGILTGKYFPGEAPPAGTRASQRKVGRFFDDPVLSAVQKLKPIASHLGLTMSQLALAWILQNKSVTSAIIGATSPKQIEENAASSGVKLDADTTALIEKALGETVRR